MLVAATSASRKGDMSMSIAFPPNKMRKQISCKALILFFVLILILVLPLNALAVHYKSGDSGPEILKIKKRLQELGYFNKGINLTRQYTDALEERVVSFRKNNGLPSSKEIDDVFLSVLYSDDAKDAKFSSETASNASTIKSSSLPDDNQPNSNIEGSVLLFIIFFLVVILRRTVYRLIRKTVQRIKNANDKKSRQNHLDQRTCERIENMPQQSPAIPSHPYDLHERVRSFRSAQFESRNQYSNWYQSSDPTTAFSNPLPEEYVVQHQPSLESNSNQNDCYRQTLGSYSNGYEYEAYVADRLREEGYTIEGNGPTRKSGDFGADIICEKDGIRYAIQCKMHSGTAKVGYDAIQQVISGAKYYQCDKAIVITNTDFTRNAREAATRIDSVTLRDHFI